MATFIYYFGAFSFALTVGKIFSALVDILEGRRSR